MRITKNFLRKITPLGAIIIVFFLVSYANVARTLWHDGFGRQYQLIYLGLYVLSGAVIAIDIWLCKPTTQKEKVFFAIERLFIILLILFLIFNKIFHTNITTLGTQVWGVFVGIEVAIAIMHLIPSKS